MNKMVKLISKDYLLKPKKQKVKEYLKKTEKDLSNERYFSLTCYFDKNGLHFNGLCDNIDYEDILKALNQYLISLQRDLKNWEKMD